MSGSNPDPYEDKLTGLEPAAIGAGVLLTLLFFIGYIVGFFD